MNEPALLNTCHSVQVSRILKWRVARTYQADVLLKVCLVLPVTPDCLKDVTHTRLKLIT